MRNLNDHLNDFRQYFGPCVRKITSWCVICIAQFVWSFEWQYFGPCVRKITSRCVIWMIIRMTVFEWSFEWWYFGPCVRKITSRCVIWNAQFKWWSDVILHTHDLKYRLSNDHSNCAILIKIQIAHFCSRVKTVKYVLLVLGSLL